MRRQKAKNTFGCTGTKVLIVKAKVSAARHNNDLTIRAEGELYEPNKSD